MNGNENQSGNPEEHRDDVGAKIGMWLFLFTELLLFGGLFLLYAIYRFKYPQEFHHAASELNWLLGAANTVILLTSSFTMVLSVSSLQKGRKTGSILALGMTIFFALLFLVNKFFEWRAKIDHGLYPGSPELLERSHGEVLFYGLYYVMTGLHGIHVLAGVILLSVILVLVSTRQIGASNFVALENSGLYWHLVDIIWIYLFPLFYLIA
jgi:cytochrome c oxidase subunit 3